MTIRESCRQGTEINSVATIEITTCPACGTLFGVQKTMLDSLRQTRESFYCPSGHRMSYGESEADRLRAQLAREAQYREQAESQLRDAERRRSAIKGVLTKERKRIANGVCPCCNRTFENLHRHMSTKHPDFKHEEEEQAKPVEENKDLPADPPELLTVAEVAKIKGVQPVTVYNAISGKKLPARRYGHRIQIARKDVDAWKLVSEGRHA